MKTEPDCMDANRDGAAVRQQSLVNPLDLLESLIESDHNLQLWCSAEFMHEKRYYVWSTKMGKPLADAGESTLEAAIRKYHNTHGHK